MDETMNEASARSIAAALEQHSRHPIARAFEMPTDHRAFDVEVVPGEGVAGVIDGTVFRLGKPGFAMLDPPEEPPGDGTWVLLAADEAIAWFRLSDEPREEAAEVVAALKRDLEISLYTGDVGREASRLAQSVGIEDVLSQLSPEDKLTQIRQLQDAGEHVLMIGDGINDAAAMGAADSSLAVSPVDVVVQEAADATLIHAHLDRIPMVIAFARRARRIIRQNITWAICYNVCVIPLAVTGVIVPWMAALGMSMSSMLVVLNANRLHGLGRVS
jgi:Cu2+-exporting ATPase